MEAWKLSDNEKQIIKKEAKRIKNFLATMEYDNCAYFIEGYCSSYSVFLKRYMEGFLPFVKEKKYISEKNAKELVSEIDAAIKHIKPYLTRKDFIEKQDMIDFIVNKYDEVDLIEKIIDYSDEKFLSKLLNAKS